MNHIAGLDRAQTLLFPERLEDYITPENPVRFLDAFIARQDLAALGFAKVRCADTGRPPYDPAVLLKLYLYGYLHRIRSSRRLEAECARNVELIRLTGKLCPDFKTIGMNLRLVMAVMCVPIPPLFFDLPLRQMMLPLRGPMPVISQILAINFFPKLRAQSIT